MHRGGQSWKRVVVLALFTSWVASGAKASPGTSSSRPVLVTPVVGSDSVSQTRRDQIEGAVRTALGAEGFPVSVAEDLLGEAVIECQTSECVGRALDAAGAEFAIVPALWERKSGDDELTLTLVQREGRNRNVDTMLVGAVEHQVRTLVVELLNARPTEPGTLVEAPSRGRHPNAWLAGPTVLVAGGAAAFIAIGVGAATKSDTEQLNAAAVGAWSAVGVAALAGGTAWWVVGAKRRRAPRQARQRAPVVTLGPTQVDLRLRF